MGGLPWIEIDTTLPGHRKSVRLGLRLDDEWAWRYMVKLWLWAADQLPAGDLTGPDAGAIIEHAAGWRGEAGKFVDATVEVGFIDRLEDGYRLHGWEERAAAHIAKMKRDRERAKDRYKRISKRFKGKPKETVSAKSPRRIRGDSSDLHGNPNPNPNRNRNPNPLKETDHRIGVGRGLGEEGVSPRWRALIDRLTPTQRADLVRDRQQGEAVIRDKGLWTSKQNEAIEKLLDDLFAKFTALAAQNSALSAPQNPTAAPRST